jgi:hypothetical protein
VSTGIAREEKMWMGVQLQTKIIRGIFAYYTKRRERINEG